jgi:hypothetical protein
VILLNYGDGEHTTALTAARRAILSIPVGPAASVGDDTSQYDEAKII